MKNKNHNKGFSLVELIVVVLVMAIIAVVVAPQVTAWVKSSRVSSDVQLKDSLTSFAQMALTDANAYDDVSSTDEIQIQVTNDGNATISRSIGSGSVEDFAKKFAEYAGVNYIEKDSSHFEIEGINTQTDGAVITIDIKDNGVVAASAFGLDDEKLGTDSNGNMSGSTGSGSDSGEESGSVEQYTIKYVPNGGSGTEKKVTKDKNSNYSIESCLFAKSGSVFDGWNTKADKSGTSYSVGDAYKVISDLTLYAQWRPDDSEYSVVFNANGGSDVSTQKVKAGEKVTRPANPTKANSTFAGWYKENACTNPWDFDNDTVTGNITLYANWTTAPSVEVKFDSKGGSSVPSQSVAKGGLVTEPAAPTKTDSGSHPLAFGGWYKEAACTNPWNFDTDTVLAAMTLYAKWEVEMTFDLQGKGTNFTQRTSIGGKMSAPESPAYDGVIFDGWHWGASGNSTVNFATQTFDYNSTIYAHWIEGKTVTFNLQGKGTNFTQTVKNNEKATKPTAPTYDGYRFDDWYKDSACKQKYDFNTKITQNTTIYAKWVKQVKVTFDYQGHGTNVTNTVDEGTKIEKPADPTATGFIFRGWYTNSSFTETSKCNFGPTDKADSDITLYAKWDAVTEVQVQHYIDNKAWGNPETVTIGQKATNKGAGYDNIEPKTDDALTVNATTTRIDWKITKKVSSEDLDHYADYKYNNKYVYISKSSGYWYYGLDSWNDNTAKGQSAYVIESIDGDTTVLRTYNRKKGSYGSYYWESGSTIKIYWPD